MRKRLIFPILFLLAATSILLLITIFKLYTEAEKVQKSIFVNEVLVAGDEVINKIDNVLKGDTLELPKIPYDTEISDSSQAVIHKYAKKFLMDSLLSKPIGVVRSTISYKQESILITQYDTTYFDTNYRSHFPYLSGKWETYFDATQFEDKKNVNRANKYKMDINLLEMDSNTIALLNREFLNRIIKESLGEIARKHDFDFALYNAFTTQFVVPPALVNPETILSSEYVFSLKNSDRFIAPHYLILYFPMERGIYFDMMKTIALLILLFLGIIILISGFTLFYLHRQKKISDVRNDFINNITHEFKTPIATISLACEAIADESTLEDITARMAYVSIIKDENERLKNMVNNILQLAQLKKGQLKMNVEKFDVHALIKSVAESVALQISSSHGTLSLHLDAEDPIIFGDKTHIENTIINLIENAIKYSKNNPNIEISTKNEKKTLIISVKDHGIGIAKKNRKKIFQEFYRISKGNIHDNKGFGMGLDYVKKVVSLHGGTITVESEPNKGSIFTLYLPNKKE